MGERYLFFDSTADDERVYQQSDIADYWGSFLKSGVIHHNFVPNLKVFAYGNNRKIYVEPGKAIIDGHLYINGANLDKDIDEPDSLLGRIDRVVLRFDNTIDNRFIKVFIKKGETSESPIPPELTRTEEIYELSLAQISIVAGKSFVEQSDIVDERYNQKLCGLASSLVSVPTDDFMEQWNEWFYNLKGSTYVTVNELRVSENNIKRELANLNLQLEASRRVPNGVTFGTNFDTSFEMDIDYTRTFSVEELSITETNITVDDVAGLAIGQEVTIYDDVNLERRKILNITGYVIEVEALTKPYKAGVNVARSMAIADVVNNSLKFGVWGTYSTFVLNTEKVYIADRENRNDTVTGANRIALLDNELYVVSGTFNTPNSSWGCMILKKTNNTWGYFSSANIGGVSANKEFVQILPIDGKLWIFSANNLLIVSPNGTVAKAAQSIIYSDAPKIMVDDQNKRFWLWNGNVLREYSWDTSYTVTLVSTKTPFTTSSAGANVITRIGDTFYLARIYSNTLTIDTNSSIFSTSLSEGWSSNTLSVPTNLLHIVALFESNGKLHLVYIKTDGSNKVLCEIISNNNGLTWSTEIMISIIDSSTDTLFRNNGAFKDAADNVFVVFLRGYVGYWCKFNKKNDAWEYGVQKFHEDITTSWSSASFGTAYSRDIIIKKPITASYNYPDQNNIHVQGQWQVGNGAPITINDVRFTTKPTKEAVAWIQSEDGLAITDGTLNGRNMELTVHENETQLVGVKYENDIGEIRFTMQRASVDDDVKVKKILGGVE